MVAVPHGQVEVELADGQRALANAELKPGLVVGDWVLVDGGLVIETIAADEAQAILEMYEEIGEMPDAEDALAVTVAPPATVPAPPRPAANQPQEKAPT
ncbi:MAG TPA: HypC/HybG/HupF family hydrogenase formation chaperone [Chloroflexota bacterium]|nr:HypC/HybG/HupF family hydrogenase formation chaperone [Chloroflexota bacterium]